MTIEQRADFHFIRYANCWEDADILSSALKPGAGDRILSVGSAGDNALALLGQGAEVVAVDLNPAQIACIHLRKEAFRHLSHIQLLRFLGIKSSENRWSVFRSLASELPDSVRDFWTDRARQIKQGFIHTGKFERYFHCFRRFVLPLIHSRGAVNKLLEKKSKTDRYRFYRKHWANLRWHGLFHLFFSRRVMGWLGRDPAMFDFVDGPVSERVLKRTRHALTELPTHDNPYLSYILTGNYTHRLPLYLRKPMYKKIRNRLDRLEIQQGKIDDVAASYGTNSFDGFNLSDIFEYMDEAHARNVFDDLIRSGKPGAKMAYWNNFVPRKAAEYFPDRLRYLKERSRTLFARDRAFFYGSFRVEEVR